LSDFFFVFCHEVPRVAIFDDVTCDVIMTSFADLPGKFKNCYIVSLSSNHNSDFTNKTKIQLYHENWWVNNVTIKMLFSGSSKFMITFVSDLRQPTGRWFSPGIPVSSTNKTVTNIPHLFKLSHHTRRTKN
jgi:hypothetical protein